MLRRCVLFTLLLAVSSPLVAQNAAPLADDSALRLTVPGIAVPRLVKFSGVLDVQGESSRQVTFSVFGDQGSALWSESQTVAVSADGKFTVTLGATQKQGIPQDIFASGEARWLEVREQGSERAQRLLMVSVPYALKAEDAERFAGRSINDFVLSESLKQEVANAVAKSITSNDAQRAPEIGSNVINSGTPGVPTNFSDNSAVQVLLVQQNGSGIAIEAQAVSGPAIKASSAGTTIQAVMSGTNGNAIYGLAQASSGVVTGVRGESPSASGKGVQGIATASSGNTIGVQGAASSSTGVGVRGENFSPSGGTAVSGVASATSGASIGVHGETASTGGVAGDFQQTASSGLILRASQGAVAKFTVDTAGNVVTTGTLQAAGLNVTGTIVNFPSAQFSSNSGSQTISATNTGSGTGIIGSNTGLSGVGVAGKAQNPSGNGIGILGEAAGTGGIAGVFNNTSGGKVLSGRNNGQEVFAVNAAGNSIVYATQSAPGVLNASLTNLPPSAIQGVATGTTDTTAGVLGIASSPDGGGVVGANTLTTGQGTGVVGVTMSANGRGVEGNADATGPGQNIGVRGNASADNGIGVEGVAEANSPTGISYGVHGVTNTTATNDSAGVFGEASGAAVGVFGRSNGDFAAGVLGVGNTVTPGAQTVGVEGDTNSPGSFGLIGQNFNNTPGSGGIGVLGGVSDDAGVGILGRARSLTGNTVGVLGSIDSSNGVGVVGKGKATTGATTGVRGIVFSNQGTAGVFVNTAAGKILSGQNGTTEVFSVDGAGVVRGDGSGLTNVTATSAANAINASQLGGIAAANYARLDQPNSFVGNLAIGKPVGIAALDVNGSVVATGASISGNTPSGTPLVDMTQTGADVAIRAQAPGVGPMTSTHLLGAITAEATDTSGSFISRAIVGQADGPLGRGVQGVSLATTGNSLGVIGFSNSVDGVGVLGQNNAGTGNPIGVAGVVTSPTGVAGDFSNNGGGDLIRGWTGTNGDIRVFTVDGSGSVLASAFVGDGSRLTNIGAANSSSLGGVPASGYARNDISNVFSAQQFFNNGLVLNNSEIQNNSSGGHFLHSTTAELNEWIFEEGTPNWGMFYCNDNSQCSGNGLGGADFLITKNRNDGTQGFSLDGLTGIQPGTNATIRLSARDGGAYFAGKVGVGTSTPFDQLDVVSSVGSHVLIGGSAGNLIRQMCVGGTCGASNPNGGGLSIQGGSDEGAGGSVFFGGSGRADSLVNGIAFYQNNIEIARFQNGGNLGLGISNPSVKLDVAGNVRASAFIGDGSQLAGIPSFGSNTFTGNQTINGNVTATGIAVGSAPVPSNPGDIAASGTVTSAAVLTQQVSSSQAGGNLQVSAQDGSPNGGLLALRAGNALGVSGGTGGNVQINAGDGSGTNYFDIGIAGILNLAAGNNNFGDGGGVILQAGNATGNGEVGKQANGGAIQIRGGNGVLSGGNLLLLPGTGSFSGSGSVGINTTTPAAGYALDVNGAVRGSSFAGDGSGLANVNAAAIGGTLVSATAPVLNQVLAFDGTQWAPATAGTGGGITGSGVAGQLTEWNGTGSLTSAPIVESGGRLALGSTIAPSPRALVDINGTVSMSSFVGALLQIDGTVLSSPQGYLKGQVITPNYDLSGGYANYIMGMEVGPGTLVGSQVAHSVVNYMSDSPNAVNGSDCVVDFGINVPNQSGACAITGTPRYFGFFENGSNAGTMNYFAHKVGIGNFAPTATLDVSGSTATTTLTVGGGSTMSKYLSASATLSGVVPHPGCVDMAATVTGSQLGDVVSLGIPAAWMSTDSSVTVTGWVSAPDTVSVRACSATTGSSISLPSATVKISIFE